jgi:hypothetical protein
VKKWLAAALLFLATVPEASAKIDCSLFLAASSREHLVNVGLYGTTDPTMIMIPECVDESGFYGNLFLNRPFDHPGHGQEVDLRLGRRFNVGPVEVDASIAGYWFELSQTPLRFRQTAEALVVVGQPLQFGDWTVKPYVAHEYQGLFPANKVLWGIAPGLELKHEIAFAFAPAHFSMSAQANFLPISPTRSHGPVTLLSAALTFDLWGMTVGPKVTLTEGSVIPDDHRLRATVAQTAFIKF